MANLANICIQLIEERLTELEQPQAVENEEVVHQLRVLTKRLRAAWHLAQPVCGKNHARHRRKALRELSSLLAQSRDQSVQIALAEKLRQEHPDISQQSLTALFDYAHTSPIEVGPIPVTKIQQALQQEIASWEKIRLSDKERSTLRHRWRKSFKKAKKLTKQISDSNDPELWHSWRKAVKRLRYQREFLAMINPRILGKKDARIRNLGTRLGEHNDLTVFSRQLDLAALKPREANALKKAVALENRNIKRNCRRLGRKLFG